VGRDDRRFGTGKGRGSVRKSDLKKEEITTTREGDLKRRGVLVDEERTNCKGKVPGGGEKISKVGITPEHGNQHWVCKVSRLEPKLKNRKRDRKKRRYKERIYTLGGTQ